MIKYLKYSKYLVLKNLGLNMLILIQLIISSCLISFIFTYNNSLNQEIKAAKKLINGLYVTDMGDFNYEMANYIIERYETTITYNSKETELELISYDAYEKIDSKLYKGRWFSNKNEIVVSSDFKLKIGDEIKLFDKSFKVVGIIPNKHLGFRLGGGSSIPNNVELKSLFKPSEGNKMILPIDALDKTNFMKMGSYINFLEEPSSYIDIINKTGKATTISSMIENTLYYSNKTNTLLIFISIIILLLVFLSSFLIIILSIKKSMKFLSVLYLQNASIKDIRIIYLFSLIYLVLISLFIIIILRLSLYKEIIRDYGNSLIEFISLFILALIYFIILNISINKLIKKKEILNSLKEVL